MLMAVVRRWWWLLALAVVLAAAAMILRDGYSGAGQDVADLNEAPPAGGWTVEVTYIANAGVMLRAGDTKVLIDGLFRPYESYPVLPETYRDQLERGLPPFDGIDVILVSHVHGDHFHPESVARYLRSVPDAYTITSEQVAAAIEQVGGVPSVSSQVSPLTLGLGAVMPIATDYVAVEALNVGHGDGRHADVANFGHVIRLGGLKFLHVGDADYSQGVLEQFGLGDQGIDVAFLPEWFLNDGADFVRTHIRPKHIVAIHMSPGARRGQGVGAFPDAVPFVRMLERRYY